MHDEEIEARGASRLARSDKQEYRSRDSLLKIAVECTSIDVPGAGESSNLGRSAIGERILTALTQQGIGIVWHDGLEDVGVVYCAKDG